MHFHPETGHFTFIKLVQIFNFTSKQDRFFNEMFIFVLNMQDMTFLLLRQITKKMLFLNIKNRDHFPYCAA